MWQVWKTEKIQPMKPQKQFKYHRKGEQPSITTRSHVFPDRRTRYRSELGSRLWTRLALPNSSLKRIRPLGLSTEETDEREHVKRQEREIPRGNPGLPTMKKWRREKTQRERRHKKTGETHHTSPGAGPPWAVERRITPARVRGRPEACADPDSTKLQKHSTQSYLETTGRAQTLAG